MHRSSVILAKMIAMLKKQNQWLGDSISSVNKELEIRVLAVKPMSYSMSTNQESYIFEAKIYTRINNNNIIFNHERFNKGINTNNFRITATH